MRKSNTIWKILKTSYRARFSCVLAIALCVLAGASAPATTAPVAASAVTIERIIAKVDDEIIMLSELQEFVKPSVDKLRRDYRGEQLNRRIRELELEALDAMVQSKLIAKRASALELNVSEKEIEKAVAGILRQNKTTTARLRSFLSSQGMTMEEYREELRKKLLARKVENMEVGVRVSVVDQEIADYYDAHSDDYREAEKRTVRQIFFPVNKAASAAEIEAQRKKADFAYEEATKPGADFPRLAEKHSEGPAQSRGGALGSVKKGEVFPELEQLIFSTAKGETSKPTRTRVGFHVIHVDEVKPGTMITLDRVSGKIRNKLFNEKFTKRRREWITELKRAAFLEISYDPVASPGGLSSVFKDVREQISFRLVGIKLKQGGRGLFGQDRVLWAYGSNRDKPRWKSDRVKVGEGAAVGKDAIGALELGNRLFVNPDPSANVYLFRYVYLLPDSYIGKISFADMIKAFSDQSKGDGEEQKAKAKKMSFETDNKAARLDFEVEVQKTRSIVADPKEITQ